MRWLETVPLLGNYFESDAEQSYQSTELDVTGAGKVPVEKDYYVLLNESVLDEELPHTSEGDPLLLTNTACEIEPALFGEVRVSEAVEETEIGVGVNLRYAIGAETDSPIVVTEIDPPQRVWYRRLLDDILAVRPVLCRVHTTAIPDPGFRVARIDEDIQKFTGVEEGDRLILESATGKTTAQALLSTPAFEARKRTEQAMSESFPNCASVVETTNVSSVQVDLPAIYLDYGTRDHLGLDTREDPSVTTGELDVLATGVCQPIRVYRDSLTFFLRMLNDITLPVVFGLVGFIVVFDEVLTLASIVGLLFVIVAVILASLIYRTRKFTVG